jgi:hypothetical protein
MTNGKDKKGLTQPEIGNIAVIFDDERLITEADRDLKFPRSLATFDRMSKSSVVASVLSAVRTIAKQPEFYLDSFDQSKEHLDKKEFVRQCLFVDMKAPFSLVVQDFLTCTKDGFSILEKVFRERRYSEGSLYNDGRIGIKYLPLRHQRSIIGLERDEKTNEIIGVKQNVTVLPKMNLNSLVSSIANVKDGYKTLPLDRILFFRVNGSSQDEFGISPLADAYKSWRILEEIRDTELVSANRNLNGIPHLSCPSEIMEEDEDDPESKKRVLTLKTQMGKIATGEQAYVITPSDRYDQTEGASAQYSFQLITGSSSHLTALRGIISNYKNEVFQAMCADVLTIDDGQSASSSLTSNKQTMFNMFVEARLNEFVQLINEDLIPDLFSRNGWDITKTPKLKFGRVEKLTVAELAKAIQQLSATQKVPITAENINHIMEVFGFPYRVPLDTPFDELIKMLGYGLDMQSRSGDGMEKGSGNGTSDKVASRDNNASNVNKS